MLHKLMLVGVGLMIFQLAKASDFQLVTRNQWKARAPSFPSSPLQFPISRVIIGHTVSPECKDTELCISSVRSIQDYHIDICKFGDIGYNFLVGGDGLVYEGRGWSQRGTYTKGHNNDSIGVGFIGNYDKKAPTSRQLQVAQLLLEEGIVKNILKQNYKLYGQRQLHASISPGDVLYKIIKKWPHWAPF